MLSLWKSAIFDLLFTFLVTRENTQKFLSHIAYLHIHIFSSPFHSFHLTSFAKVMNLLYLVSLWYEFWCWFLFALFWSNQWITKWRAKFELECQLLIFIYSNSKCVVIRKKKKKKEKKLWLPVGKDKNNRKYQKHSLLAVASVATLSFYW